MRFFSCVEKAVLPYPLILCSVGGAFFAFFLACFLRKTSAFIFCGGALALVCVYAAKLCREFSAEDIKAFCVCLFTLYALLYAAYLIIVRLAVKKEARRRRFEEMKLRTQYVLPERGNGYVRDKLRETAVVSGAYSFANSANSVNSARNLAGKPAADAAGNGVNAQSAPIENGAERNSQGNSFVARNEVFVEENSEEYEEARVELSHARGLIKKLKKAELSLCDRLETERLEGEITAFSCNSRLTAKDFRTLSDCFSALLKLTAKYVV